MGYLPSHLINKNFSHPGLTPTKTMIYTYLTTNKAAIIIIFNNNNNNNELKCSSSLPFLTLTYS